MVPLDAGENFAQVTALIDFAFDVSEEVGTASCSSTHHAVSIRNLPPNQTDFALIYLYAGDAVGVDTATIIEIAGKRVFFPPLRPVSAQKPMTISWGSTKSLKGSMRTSSWMSPAQKFTTSLLAAGTSTISIVPVTIILCPGIR